MGPMKSKSCFSVGFTVNSSRWCRLGLQGRCRSWSVWTILHVKQNTNIQSVIRWVLWVRFFKNYCVYSIFFVCGKIWVQNSAFNAVIFYLKNINKKQAHVATRLGFYFEGDNLAICFEAYVMQLSGWAVKDTGLFTNSRSQHVQNAEVMSQHFLTSLLRNSLPEWVQPIRQAPHSNCAYYNGLWTGSMRLFSRHLFLCSPQIIHSGHEASLLNTVPFRRYNIHKTCTTTVPVKYWTLLPSGEQIYHYLWLMRQPINPTVGPDCY